MTQNNSLKELLRLNTNDEKYSEKQLKILEAAIETFSEKGYAASSTNEIAKKAGVAEGTIFRHYKTKKELLLSIVTPLMTKLLGPFVAKDFAKEIFEVNYDNFEQFIRNLAFNRYEFVKNHSSVVKILIQEISFHDELKEPYIKLFQEHIFEKFKATIIKFQEAKEIVNWPPETIIRLIINTIAGTLLSMFLLRPEANWRYEEEMELTISFLVNGLKLK
ncbi:TetR/AcrR family transcriptional regulator [Anaerobacillus alkaliphilus]|uniref:TetR/AcrR family transcriptional regulator n=1 Tax=Anaerobacillus alkaliphilus TaxID=1548597 RepID=A0A4Q0VTE4_9BACI|nr:TetR/AcrR family transcriptional regulator [Anaerobacillus alkaliphilus]RXJ00698.1 TetR/AcrR family transcriptional regulator [Anaerobacillus alkaliphilus]